MVNIQITKSKKEALENGIKKERKFRKKDYLTVVIIAIVILSLTLFPLTEMYR